MTIRYCGVIGTADESVSGAALDVAGLGSQNGLTQSQVSAS